MKTSTTPTVPRRRPGLLEPHVPIFPAGRVAASPGGREAPGGGPGGRLVRGWPIVSPFGDLAALAARRDALEEEILALWEG